MSTEKKFKVLMVADPHMQNNLPYAKPTKDGLTDRFEDQLEMWSFVKKKADEEEVDAVFILGDLFDKSKVDAVTLTHTVKVLVSFKQNVYILPGNHDANSIKGGRFVVEALGEMKKDHINIIDEQETLQVDLGAKTLEFWPIAYQSLTETQKIIEGYRKDLERRRINVLLLHHSIIGATSMSWKCDDGLDPDNICKKFDWVFSGHFHKSQKFGSGRGMYLGSPMQHDYRDAGSKTGFWIMEFTSKGMSPYFIKSKSPEFHILDDLKSKAKYKNGDYLRYEIEATHAEWKKLEPKAIALCEGLNSSGAVNASWKHKPIYHHESRFRDIDFEKFDIEEMIGEYVETVEAITQGLSSKRLKKLGRDILKTVEGK